MGLGKTELCTKSEVVSFSHCVNIEGNPQILGSSPDPGTPTLSSACDLMIGLGKPQLHAKFEVASPSRCRNIGEPILLGSSPSLRPPPRFTLDVILWWALANPSCVPNWKSLASAVVEILKGKPQISGSTPTFSSSGIWWWALANGS